MTSKRSKLIIEGIIIPYNWDENGNIKGVSIHTSDEKEYRVQHSGVGRQLLAYIHHKVEVTGKIRERLDGRLYISIRSYLTIGETSDEIAVHT
jgi:hypothetical protein